MPKTKTQSNARKRVKAHLCATSKPRPEPAHIKKDYQWAFAHYDQLARQYPEQWVAFINETVVASGKDPTIVLEKAHQKTGLSEIPHLFIENRVHFYLATRH